jgi:hypothetical protein
MLREMHIVSIAFSQFYQKLEYGYKFLVTFSSAGLGCNTVITQRGGGQEFTNNLKQLLFFVLSPKVTSYKDITCFKVAISFCEICVGVKVWLLANLTWQKMLGVISFIYWYR